MSKEPYDPMDMKSLRCFEAMAKHESLTQGGIELGISDSAVSQRIKSLEKYLPAFPKYRRYSVRREGDSAIRIMKL